MYSVCECVLIEMNFVTYRKCVVNVSKYATPPRELDSECTCCLRCTSSPQLWGKISSYLPARSIQAHPTS